jgi:hypothetical protein
VSPSHLRGLARSQSTVSLCLVRIIEGESLVEAATSLPLGLFKYSRLERLGPLASALSIPPVHCIDAHLCSLYCSGRKAPGESRDLLDGTQVNLSGRAFRSLFMRSLVVELGSRPTKCWSAACLQGGSMAATCSDTHHTICTYILLLMLFPAKKSLFDHQAIPSARLHQAICGGRTLAISPMKFNLPMFVNASIDVVTNTISCIHE